MICLHLTRDNYYEGVYLQLPATPAEIGEAFAELDEISAHTASTRIVGAISPVMNIGQYIKSADVNESGVLEKLNTLAEQIQRMGKQEKAIFSGALDAESINGLDDVLKIAGQLGQYTFIPNIYCDEDLGKFLVENGYKNFPENVVRYLDYESIGAEFHDEYGGVFSADGYVTRRSLLDGLPGISHTIFRVCLHTDSAPADLWVKLPVTEWHEQFAKSYLGIEDWVQASISRATCVQPELEEHIPMDALSMEDANELAVAVVGMLEADDESLSKFLAVLSVERPDTFPAALRLAMEQDDYALVPDDPWEYGEQVLRRVCTDQEVLDAIDGFMDYKALGEFQMKEDGVRETEYGSIRRLSEPFPAPEQGQQML